MIKIIKIFLYWKRVSITIKKKKKLYNMSNVLAEFEFEKITKEMQTCREKRKICVPKQFIALKIRDGFSSPLSSHSTVAIFLIK